MRHIPMTIPAFPVGYRRTGKVMISIPVRNNELCQRSMTGYAIRLDTIGTIFTNSNILTKGIHRKSNGMIPAVTGLCCIFIQHIVHRKMTLNTGGTLCVGAMLPRRILRIHNMTIDARLRVG